MTAMTGAAFNKFTRSLVSACAAIMWTTRYIDGSEIVQRRTEQMPAPNWATIRNRSRQHYIRLAMSWEDETLAGTLVCTAHLPWHYHANCVWLSVSRDNHTRSTSTETRVLKRYFARRIRLRERGRGYARDGAVVGGATQSGTAGAASRTVKLPPWRNRLVVPRSCGDEPQPPLESIVLSIGLDVDPA